MPSRELVQELVRYVEGHRELDAIRRFYAENAQTYENNAAPTVGLEAIYAKEERFLASLASVDVAKGLSFVVDGDRAAINWLFEFTYPNGQRIRMDEIAYQLWEGDKIIQEQYFYDPATLRV